MPICSWLCEHTTHAKTQTLYDQVVSGRRRRCGVRLAPWLCVCVCGVKNFAAQRARAYTYI